MKPIFGVQWKDYFESAKFLCDNWFKFSDSESVVMLRSAIQKARRVVSDVAWALDAELTAKNQFTTAREMRRPSSLTYFRYFFNLTVSARKEKPKNWNSHQHAHRSFPVPPSFILMLDVYQSAGGLLAKSLDGYRPMAGPVCSQTQSLSFIWLRGLDSSTNNWNFSAEKASILDMFLLFCIQPL